MMLYSPAAHADPVTVTIDSKVASGTNVFTGDSVTIKAIGTGYVSIWLYTSHLPDGSSSKVTLTSGHSAGPYHFPSSGSYGFSWTVNTLLGTSDKSATIDVVDPPPPPSSSVSSAPSNTPTGTTTGTGAGTPTGTATGTGTPTGTHTGTGAHTTPAGGGGGISFPNTSTIPNNPILGFAPPPRDPNGATPTVDPGQLGTGKGSIPNGLPAFSTTGAPATDSSGQPVLADKAKPLKVPTALAITSISALAIVSSMFAYRQLGQRAH